MKFKAHKVIISGESKKDVSEDNIQKTILKTNPRNEYLARRKSGKIYLNFYDFGQYTEDSGETWIDLDFVLTKTINVDGFGNVESIVEPTITDWNSLKDAIFETEPEEWKNVFRKFEYEKAERYGVDIYLGSFASFNQDNYFPVGRNDSRTMIRESLSSTLISNSKWTEQGLEVPKQTEHNFNLITQNGFLNIGTEAYKVTSEPDFDSDAIEFIIDASTNFYLMPSFVVESGQKRNDVTNWDLWLNLLYTQLPRSLFIDDDNYYSPSGGEWIYSPFVKRAIDYTGLPTSLTDDVIDFMTSRSESRTHQEPGGGSASFPYDATEISLSGLLSMVDDTYALVISETLLAVAEKNGEFFYFWAYNTTSNYHHKIGGFLQIPGSFKLHLD